MRGIERVITGILLVAAICGSAAFARSVGRDAATAAGDVQLTAAPPQHAQSPHGVRVPLYPLLADRPTVARVQKKDASRPSLADAPVLTSAPAAAAVRVVVARPAVQRHDTVNPVQLTKPKPGHVTDRRAPAAPAPPAPAQPEPRILAKVPLTPTPTWQHVKAVGHGRLKNRPDDDSATSPPPSAQQHDQSGAPASPSTSPTITIVVLSPTPLSGDDVGNRAGNGNGNGHGHAYGRLKQTFNDHD
jgi:hypothetical protein